MEKIIVRIGLKGSLSKECDVNKDHLDKPYIASRFLQECFEISNSKACKIVNKLKDQEPCTTRYIELILSYKQLARYTAKRQVEGLNKTWIYPFVLEFEDNECKPEHNPIELRSKC